VAVKERFESHAQEFEDLRHCGAHNLCSVDILTAGFPARTSASPAPEKVIETPGDCAANAADCFGFLADAAPVDAIPPASQSQQWPRPADAWAANTLLASKAGSQIAMGCTTLVAHTNGWDQMAERERAAASG
jgi:hypothetical protein